MYFCALYRLKVACGYLLNAKKAGVATVAVKKQLQ